MKVRVFHQARGLRGFFDICIDIEMPFLPAIGMDIKPTPQSDYLRVKNVFWDIGDARHGRGAYRPRRPGRRVAADARRRVPHSPDRAARAAVDGAAAVIACLAYAAGAVLLIAVPLLAAAGRRVVADFVESFEEDE